MDLYFERHDGQAVTCDDFLAAMADANNEDLSSVATWYDVQYKCGIAARHVQFPATVAEHATALGQVLLAVHA